MLKIIEKDIFWANEVVTVLILDKVQHITIKQGKEGHAVMFKNAIINEDLTSMNIHRVA